MEVKLLYTEYCYIEAVVYKNFSLVPYQSDDGSLYISRNMLQ